MENVIENQDGKTVEQLNIESKLSRIKLGNDNTVAVEIKTSKGVNFEFTLAVPTIKDNWKIESEKLNLRSFLKQKATLDDYFDLAILSLATLNVVVKKIVKTVDGGNKILKSLEDHKTFWDIFSGLTNSKSQALFYQEIVFPLFGDYLSWIKEIDIKSDDDLKNL